MTGRRDVIAVVDLADRPLVRFGEDGLPTLVGEGWPSVPDIAAFLGGSGLLPLSPAARLSAEPRVVLRVLTAGSAVGGQWRPLEAAGEHAEAIARFIDEWTGRQARPAGRPEWYRIGWLAEIDIWIDAVLAMSGRRRSAPTEVVQMWSLSAVLKVACDGEVVYVKASCEHFRAEARTTEVIAGWRAGAVPDVLAAEADRGWLMMAPLPESVSDDAGDSVVAAAESLALLQLQSVPRRRELPDCPDRTLARTWATFAPLVDTSLERDELSPAELTTVRTALPRLASVVEELDGCRLPSALTHGDLHGGNVAWDGRNAVLFDWSDSCWSHPILDLYHLTAHVPEDVRARAVEAYRQVWCAAFPDAEIDRALELAPTVDLMFQAVSYEGIVRAVEPMSRWENGGMVARNLRRLGGCA
jgi:fructosamine-3-kinase